MELTRRPETVQAEPWTGDLNLWWKIVQIGGANVRLVDLIDGAEDPHGIGVEAEYRTAPSASWWDLRVGVWLIRYPDGRLRSFTEDQVREQFTGWELPLKTMANLAGGTTPFPHVFVSDGGGLCVVCGLVKAHSAHHGTPVAAPAIDDRPHSRACGWEIHPHGPRCHGTCPTCHPVAPTNPHVTLPTTTVGTRFDDPSDLVE